MNPEAEFEQWYDEAIAPWFANKVEVSPLAAHDFAKQAFLRGYALAQEGRS